MKKFVIDRFQGLSDSAPWLENIPGQFSHLENASLERGVLRSRPAMVEAYSISTSSPVIALTFYRNHFYCYHENGHLRSISLDGNVVILKTEIPHSAPPLFVDADMVLLLYTGDATVIITDGNARYPDPDKESPINTKNEKALKGELPVGAAAAFCWGRVAFSSGSGREVFFGDLQLPGIENNHLFYTENSFLNEGGGLRAPTQMGVVNAISSWEVADTSLGTGPILVFYEKGVMSYAVNLPRDQWGSNPIGYAVLIGHGAVGSRAVCNIAGRVFFISRDGLRSMGLQRVDENSGSVYLQPSLSLPVAGTISLEEDAWLVADGNRIYMPAQDGTLLCLRHNLTLEQIQQNPYGVWEGMWTGLEVTAACVEDFSPLFAAAPQGNKVKLYRLAETGEDAPLRFITTEIGRPSEYVSVSSIHLSLDEMVGPVEITMWIRKEDSPSWTRLATQKIDVEVSFPAGPARSASIPFGIQKALEGSQFQIAVEMTGKASIRNLVMYAEELPGYQPDRTKLKVCTKTATTWEQYERS